MRIIFLSILFFFFQKSFAQSPDWIWSKSFGNNYTAGVNSFEVDDDMNIYCTGEYEGVVDFDPGPGVFNLTSNDDANFILKLDSSGNLVWVKSFPAVGYDIIVDSAENIYVF